MAEAEEERGNLKGVRAGQKERIFLISGHNLT